MRIKRKKANIDYKNTKNFFLQRAEKFSDKNPYSVTMYQDNNPLLVQQRNDQEIKRLLPKLVLDEESRLLDVACGIGRWSDAIEQDIERYCGTDFCEEFIDIAKERSKEKKNRSFYACRNEEVDKVLLEKGEQDFNRVLLVGAFLYLNDEDAMATLNAIEHLCSKDVVICVREPIGKKARLTLVDQFSEELGADYNAVYRTRKEFLKLFKKTLIKKGFKVVDEDWLFEESSLNNRKETAQYFFVLKR